jgi:hypothetical protein
MANAYRKQIDTFINNSANDNVFSDCLVTVSETGISSKGKFAASDYQWAGIVKKEETKEHYFLFLTTDQAIVLPKRAIASEAQKVQLEKLFAAHISFNAELGYLVKD